MQTTGTDAFYDEVRRTGMFTCVAAMVCLFVPGLFLFFVHGLTPEFSSLAQSLISVWAFTAVLAVVEPMIYFPILGFAGTYMSFMVGNVMNIRVPVAATVNELSDAKPGTVEADILTAVGIAGSVLGTTVVMLLGLLVFLPLLAVYMETTGPVSVSLDHVLDALYGALLAFFVFRAFKVSLLPLFLGIGLAFLKSDLPFAFVIPPLVVISVFGSRFMYKRKWI